MLHGNVNPILIQLYNKQVYLSCFHTITLSETNTSQKREYAHYLYIFENKSPFNIIAHSKQIQLVKDSNCKHRGFISSLLYYPMHDDNSNSSSSSYNSSIHNIDADNPKTFLMHSVQSTTGNIIIGK